MMRLAAASTNSCSTSSTIQSTWSAVSESSTCALSVDFGSLQVSQANSVASDSPMIAAGVNTPFAHASSSFDPRLTAQHHHEKHAQGEVRRTRHWRRPKSAKGKNVPAHAPAPDATVQQVHPFLHTLPMCCLEAGPNLLHAAACTLDSMHVSLHCLMPASAIDAYVCAYLTACLKTYTQFFAGRWLTWNARCPQSATSHAAKCV